MVYQTNSVQETQKVASDLAQKYRQGGILALSGPLGAGKTTFIQGFAKGLGIKERLISPTFVLMREYLLPGNKNGKLYHIDLYRLEDEKQIAGLGLEEIFANTHNIILIEWAERLGNLLPDKAVRVQLKLLTENSRQVEVEE